LAPLQLSGSNWVGSRGSRKGKRRHSCTSRGLCHQRGLTGHRIEASELVDEFLVALFQDTEIPRPRHQHVLAAYLAVAGDE